MTGEFLVPLLRTDAGSPDPIAIETWHLALGSAVAVELPHDLFGVWLFPLAGGVVLLGPEALAADRVEIPAPAPTLQQDQLYRLEEILRRAKYLSAIAAPIRHAGRDVGLILLGSFTRGEFGPRQAIALRRLGAQLAPTMAELASRMPAASPRPLVEPDLTRESLPEHMARAACEAVNGTDLVSRASAILYPLLPHDRLEILTRGTASGSYVGLSGNAARRRWSAGSSDPLGAIVAHFGDSPTLLVGDLEELDPPVEWDVGSHTLSARSLVGARLAVGGATIGYVFIASVAQDLYRPEDEDTLATAALLLGARVAALRQPGEGPRPPAQSSESGPAPIHRAAAVLAETMHLGEGLQRFGAELGGMLAHQGMSIHLRRGDNDVVTLDPDAPHPLADLPAVRIGRFEGEPLLEEERDWLLLARPEGEELMVPLRVAGRCLGTLGVRSTGFPSPSEAAALLRQFADVLAPHLELLRRGATTSAAGGRIRVAGA